MGGSAYDRVRTSESSMKFLFKAGGYIRKVAEWPTSNEI